MTVIATAGHVDHGKSTLVEALTGTHPDRWAAERERGLTIDLGFAALDLPRAGRVAIVDVPGHIRFLPNMLAGVGPVAAGLFVVDATEGWRAQSEEHLRILELAGIVDGIVAVTKRDLVTAERLAGVTAEVREHLVGSAWAGADLVAVDARSGFGLDELVLVLDTLVSGLSVAPDRGRPRLWIDRSFTMRGAGVVVTGTLLDGTVAVGDDLVVVPDLLPVRVRGLHQHGDAIDHIGAGHRVALNLSGTERRLDHRQLRRGDVLVRSGDWHLSRVVDVALDVLAGVHHRVGRRGSYLAYLGAGEFPVRLTLLGDDGIAPGSGGAARLHFDDALPLLPGDRFVLRDTGRGETIGGGEVLDVDPVLRPSQARPDRRVERVVREHGWILAADLARRTGVDVAPTLGDWVVDPDALDTRRRELHRTIDESGEVGVALATLDDRDRLVVTVSDDVTVADGRAWSLGNEPSWTTSPILDALRADLFHPPDVTTLGAGAVELRELQRRGLVVRRDGHTFATEAVDRAAEVVAGLLAAEPDGVTLAQVRDALGTARSYAAALLGLLDDAGRTRRRHRDDGRDVRVGGPRLGA